MIDLRRFRIGIFLLTVVLCEMGCGRSETPTAGGMTIEHWLESLEDESVELRVMAVKKIGNIGIKHWKALPAVVQALSDESPEVRKAAIHAVVRNWPASSRELQRLETMKNDDDDSDVRKIAEEAHRNLGDKKNHQRRF